VRFVTRKETVEDLAALAQPQEVDPLATVAEESNA